MANAVVNAIKAELTAPVAEMPASAVPTSPSTKTRKPRTKKSTAQATAVNDNKQTDIERKKAENAAMCAAELAKRGCKKCKPHHDVKTVKMWNALGYRVNKGEKAMKVALYSLFCRCQVSKVHG